MITRRFDPPHAVVTRVAALLPEAAWAAAAVDALHRAALQVFPAASCDHLLDLVAQSQADVVLVDLDVAGDRRAELAHQIAASPQQPQAVWIGVEPAAACAGLGGWALQRTEHGLEVDLAAAVERAADMTSFVRENERLRRRLAQRRTRELIGQSSVTDELRARISDAAQLETSVLILGEAGTGKALAARLIHESSDRSYRPLITIDCRVWSAAALERELLGFDNGREATPGRFELAEGGTLVLLGVDQIALPLQMRLAKVFESRQYTPLDGNETRSLRARVIATSTANLPALIERGLFREDLYAPLCASTIVVLPLRERLSDVALLVEHFLQQVARREGSPPRRLGVDALELLKKQNWPGNVRELQQVVERTCAVERGTRLTAEMVMPWLDDAGTQAETVPGLTLAEMERRLIESTFNRFAGNRERTARALQIGLRTLSGKLREYGYPPRGGPGSNQQFPGREARAA